MKIPANCMCISWAAELKRTIDRDEEHLSALFAKQAAHKAATHHKAERRLPKQDGKLKPTEGVQHSVCERACGLRRCLSN